MRWLKHENSLAFGGGFAIIAVHFWEFSEARKFRVYLAFWIGMLFFIHFVKAFEEK